MRKSENIIYVSLWRNKLSGVRCWVSLALILQGKLWMKQGDAVVVARATKYGVHLRLHFHVIYFYYCSTFFLLDLVEKLFLIKRSPFSISV